MSFQSSLPPLLFTDEIDRPYPFVFLYAIAGAGKTNSLRTLAPLTPLVLATEDGQTKGMSTLADLHLPAILIDQLDHLVAVTADLKKNAKPGQLFYGGKGPFGACAVDSFTGVGPMLERASCAMKGWTSIWGDVGQGQKKDPRTAYPYIAEKGRQVVRALMELPVPLVITAREQVVTEGEGAAAKSYAAPELPGQKLPRELPGWPEATVRLRMLNGKRTMVTENEGDVVARVRLREGWRLDKYAKPDLYALIRVLQGNQDALKELKLV